MTLVERREGRVRTRAARRHRRPAREGDRAAAPARRPARSCSATCSAAARPTAFDRWLATRFGLHAVTAVADKDYGTMVALRGTDIVRVPLADGTGELKLVQPEEYAEAEVFFG